MGSIPSQRWIGCVSCHHPSDNGGIREEKQTVLRVRSQPKLLERRGEFRLGADDFQFEIGDLVLDIF
jgi:hypothetical protein